MRLEEERVSGARHGGRFYLASKYDTNVSTFQPSSDVTYPRIHFLPLCFTVIFVQA